MNAERRLFADGRVHLQHGPIDLVIGAEGDVDAVNTAHAAAWEQFQTVLPHLVAELSPLRLRIRPDALPHHNPMRNSVARAMWDACWPHRAQFITPMAAVAGAVADAVAACYRREGIARAWVNNGGDIALMLALGASARVGLVADIASVDLSACAQGGSPGAFLLDGRFDIGHDMPVRGVATSGWRGRSFSLGIADSVTVLAATAACADACATMVANAVNVDDARIQRRPASQLKDDSDLGDLPVTVHVPPLDPATVEKALTAGMRVAESLRARGLLWGALLTCQGRIHATAFANPSGATFATPFAASSMPADAAARPIRVRNIAARIPAASPATSIARKPDAGLTTAAVAASRAVADSSCAGAVLA